MFSAYLWGIEITIHSMFKTWSPKVFSLPMRNWNLLLPWVSLLRQCVFSLPMRNWNRPHRCRHRPRSRFSAYLWGIETLTPASCFRRAASFQPTYEELKPYRQSMSLPAVTLFSAYLWGIETLQKKGPVWDSAFRFQPTYEELKHAFLFPMLFDSIKFSAYLWGIETKSLLSMAT